MTEPRVTLDRLDDGHIVHVQLDRPDKHNGLDLPMFEQIVAAGQGLLDDASVRAVVLSGRGKSFCAGLDVASFMGSPGASRRLLARASGPEASPANLAQRVAWVWQELEVPVIAALHGAVFGGGLQIALGADLRLVHPEARLSIMEIRHGLVPDMSMSQTLLRLVRHDVALELTWSGRKVGGDEAVALGLATRVASDPVAEALALARTIAAQRPEAVRAAKRLYSEARHLDVRAAMELETELQLGLLGALGGS